MLIQSIVFWNHTLWGYHHVIRHHQYTGMIEFDPDIRNSKPFFRKSKQLSKSKTELSDKYISIKLIVFSIFLPGTLLGQSLSYLLWSKRKYLWKMELPDIFGSKKDYLPIKLSN